MKLKNPPLEPADITKRYLMLRDEAKLDALYNNGVDNWEGFDYAIAEALDEGDDVDSAEEFLPVLERWGVDNWSYYDEAMSTVNEYNVYLDFMLKSGKIDEALHYDPGTDWGTMSSDTTDDSTADDPEAGVTIIEDNAPTTASNECQDESEDSFDHSVLEDKVRHAIADSIEKQISGFIDWLYSRDAHPKEFDDAKKEAIETGHVIARDFFQYAKETYGKMLTADQIRKDWERFNENQN